MVDDNRKTRASRNYINILITCVVLFIAIKLSDGGFSNSIDKITKNLDVALSDLSDDNLQYSNYTSTAKYVSNTKFRPKGMAGLYNLTNAVMDLILSPDFLIKGWILVDKGGSINLNKDVPISSVLSKYWLLLAVLLLLVLLAVLLPTCGLCFCCCRCCGRCGARSRPCDKRRDLCKKILLGTALIVLTTALLFCVVCAFVCNQQIQDGLDDLPGSLRHTSQDANTFLNDTKKHANHLLSTNFQEFSSHFSLTMNKSSDYVMEQLIILSNATAMTDLKKFVDKLPYITKNLTSLKNDTNSLRVLASQLSDAMRKVKKELMYTLEGCGLELCNEIKNNVSHLQTNIDFNKLPDVTPTLQEFENLKLDSLETAVNTGIKNLEGVKDNVRDHMKTALEEATNQVVENNKTIQQKLNDVEDKISNLQNTIDNNSGQYITKLEKYLMKYGEYRNYGGLAISSLLLLIAVFITFGLICGICGKRPDGYSDNCCNKGTGSQFLICSVMIMFIFGILIAVTTVIIMVLGLLSNRVVCYPLRNPEKSNVIDVLNTYTITMTKNSDLNINVTSILTKCNQNETVYKVLDLERIVNISKIKDELNLSQYIEMMKKNVGDIIDRDFTILGDKDKETLENLTNVDLSQFSFDKFQDELKENFTNLDLVEVSNKLEELVKVLNDKPEYNEVKSAVGLSILDINTYNEKLLQPMKKTAERVIETAGQLDKELKMDKSDFQTAVKNLIAEIEEATKKLGNEGPNLILNVINEFGDIILFQVKSYIDLIEHSSTHELARCGPLSLAINATLTATCDKIVLPVNGFWVTLLLALILFIPTIIVSVKLANLYQKYKPNGPYVETEYLYDAYADRDNIPLHSHNKRIKKKTKKGKKYEDRPQNMGGEVVSREFAAAAHPPDSRYADMAAKHWEDFPNGGPPQYQRAPTEYERPPPYYYPASGEQ